MTVGSIIWTQIRNVVSMTTIRRDPDLNVLTN